MRRVFADTSFFQALFSAQDQWHAAAVSVFADLDAGIVTTEYVLLELGALMSHGAARPRFVDFVERSRSDPLTRILTASALLFDEGLPFSQTGLIRIGPSRIAFHSW